MGNKTFEYCTVVLVIKTVYQETSIGYKDAVHESL